MRIQCGTILAAADLPFAASAAIDISTGRQLFVDDFLVEAATNVVRHWNRPVKMDGPVVWPGSGAAPKVVDGSSGAKPGAPVNLTCATDEGMGAFYSVVYPSKAFHAVNGYALRRMARHLNHRGQRRYRLKFADTYYGELNHYGMYWLRWADVRRRRY